MGERSDADLLDAHIAGDSDAFGELFARHRDRLWAVALRTMGNPDDAADGLQDGLIAAFRRAGSFRGESAVTTWLHRVVVNACLDRIRAAKVRATSVLPDGFDLPGDANPAADTERNEQRSMVLAALGRLPAEQRAALVLVDMEGYPVAEVAVMLGVAAGTVKSRCSRGRARLATWLTPPAGNLPPPDPVPSTKVPPSPIPPSPIP
ncbi:MAG: RNA polymerase sigma factor SigM, partial [Nocardioides sp.]